MGTLTASTTNWTNKNITLTGKATDIGSGISYYQFSTNANLTASSTGWTSITNTTSEITKTFSVSSNDTYYFYVKDKAGNINSKSIVINKIDKTAPTIKNILSYKQPIPDSLLVSYNGKENSNTTHDSKATIWKDLSGNNSNGTLTNGPTWVSNGLHFDGVNDYVKIGSMNHKYQSVEATFSVEDADRDSYVIGNWDYGGGGISVKYGRIYGEYWINDEYTVLDAGIDVKSNTVYTVSVTYNGKTMSVYVNGVLKNSFNKTGSIGVPQYDTIMVLGANPYKEGLQPPEGEQYKLFSGTIYSARVYNKGLSQSEVTRNYESDQCTLFGKKVYTATIQDSQSGISKYQYNTSTSVTASTSGWKTITNTKNATNIKDIIAEKTQPYYLYVMDAAGNIGKLKEYNDTQYTLTFNSNYLEENILGGTEDLNNYSVFNIKMNKQTVSDKTVKGGKVIKFTATSGITSTSTSPRAGALYIPVRKLTVGQTYTISVYVKSNVNKKMYIGSSQYQDSNGNDILSKTFNITTSWQKISYTFKAGDTVDKNIVFYSDSWKSGDEIYIHSLECATQTDANSFGNLVYGLENKNTTTTENISYYIIDREVAIKPSSTDGYGTTSGRVYLEKGKTYEFSATINSTWQDEISAGGVEAWLKLNDGWDNAYHFCTSGKQTFTCTQTGVYYLRLDGHEINKNFIFQDIRIQEKNTYQTKKLHANDEIGTMQTLIRDNYKFLGWYTSPTGGTKINPDDRMSAKNMTLYAHWQYTG